MSGESAAQAGSDLCPVSRSVSCLSRPGRQRPFRTLSPARRSGRLLIRIAPGDVGLFRFLLEAHDNLALFTVLDSRAGLLKLLFSPHQKRAVRLALEVMSGTVTFSVADWPV